MSMFGSYRPRPSQPPDGIFPRLGTDDVAYIEDLIVGSFAPHNVVATVNGAEITLSGGQTYPAREVMDACADSGEPESWVDVVDRWVARVITVRNMPSSIEFGDHDMLTKVHTRLITTDFAEDLDEQHSYHTPVVGTLHAVLGVELPQATAVLTDEELSGHHLEMLWAQGQRASNYLQVNAERVPQSRYDLKYVAGDTVFISGKVLDFPALLDHVIGEAPWGVLFSVPAANIIIWHVARDSSSTVRAIDELAQSTSLTIKDSPAPLSSEIYYWYAGIYSRAAFYDDNNSLQRDPGSPLWGVIDDMDDAPRTPW